jgi:SAM-dependent methyltransferase/uncharacterized protein YbaR (Trm112 family)
MEKAIKDDIWRCLQCREPLAADALALRCAACGALYPVIGGIPILVKEPAAYVRSELAALARASRDAKQRWEILDKSRDDAGLTAASLARHRDVIDAEIAQIATFLALLEPAAEALSGLDGRAPERMRRRRAGWTFDALFPYLLRDWTGTAELEAAASMIRTALKQAFPDPAGKRVAVAGCGAGGLLAKIAPDAGRVVGFDLTLAILRAARHLLDGNSLDLALPRCIGTEGRIRLRNGEGMPGGTAIDVVAMDAFDTAFADGSVDCVITSFLLDLIPDPRRLAAEIHRVLRDGGVWIAYGPSGPVKALWRFDQAECASFFEAAGFTPIRTEAHRTTYLDLSRDYPSWSSQNHMCYLTSARKTQKPAEKTKPKAQTPAALADIVPRPFPRAHLIHRQALGPEQKPSLVLRHERFPGRMESFEIGHDDARILALVDGQRTVRDIVELLKNSAPVLQAEETIRAFAGYFERGVLSWRGYG